MERANSESLFNDAGDGSWGKQGQEWKAMWRDGMKAKEVFSIGYRKKI